MSAHRQRPTTLKRAIDIVGASIGLLLLSPIIGVLWILVRTKLGSPVLFKQERPGKNGELFTLYKFRSMLEENHDRGLITDDQRMTAFGRRLRATSLDELPTLVNVLKGDMSLVGPRPLVVEYLPLYSAYQARRHEVRPGITGLAQVKGRNALSWDDRFNLDIEYVGCHNLALDVQILFQTVRRVFSKSDIEGEGISTMTMFVGEAPQDGLTEEVLNHQWEDLWNSWITSEQTVRIGALSTEQSTITRYWVYFHDGMPIGIGGLSGLGTQHLEASIMLGPNQQHDQYLHALLNRLTRHAKSYDATRVTALLPTQHRTLFPSFQKLGYVATNDHATIGRDQPGPTDTTSWLAFATKIGA